MVAAHKHQPTQTHTDRTQATRGLLTSSPLEAPRADRAKRSINTHNANPTTKAKNDVAVSHQAKLDGRVCTKYHSKLVSSFAQPCELWLVAGPALVAR